jgi:proteic killer suppression protein
MPAKKTDRPPTKKTTILLMVLLTCDTWRVTVRDDKDDPPQGTEAAFEEDDPKGVNPEHAEALRDILATLHAAPTLAHMNQPKLRLHPLKGQMKGFLGCDRSSKLAGDFSF